MNRFTTSHYLPVPAYQIRVWIVGVEPIVHRRFLLPSHSTFADLHQIMQLAFGWSGRCLYRFNISGAAIGSPETFGGWTTDSAEITSLASYMLYEGQRFSYGYGIESSWRIEVRIERLCALEDGQIPFRCLAGKRAAPLEQCGGAAAFTRLQAVFTPAYVNERMQAICTSLLTEKLWAPEWEAEIAEMQIELEELRYWLKQEQFCRRELNQQLKQFGTHSITGQPVRECVA